MISGFGGEDKLALAINEAMAYSHTKVKASKLETQSLMRWKKMRLSPEGVVDQMRVAEK